MTNRAVDLISRSKPSERRTDLVWMLGLACATFFAYLPALDGDFVWDDDTYIVRNETLRTADGLRRIWLQPGATPQYYPLVFTAFWLEHHLWGNRPAGFHVVNVALHATTAVFLGLVLRRLGIPGAPLAAALFALHPVQVESVAWITERKNVLSGLLYMASLLAFLRYRAAAGRARSRPEGDGAGAPPTAPQGASSARRNYVLSLFLFLLALSAKTATVTLPATLLLLAWWRAGRLARRDVMDAAPFFLIAIPAGLLTAYVESEFVGAMGESWSLSGVQRVLLAGRALWFYLGKLIYPAPLTFIYPRWTIDTDDAMSYVYPLAFLAVLVIFALIIRRSGRGPLAAILYFAGTLTPMLGFFSLYVFRYAYVADHFQYLAAIGIMVLLAAGAARAARRASWKWGAGIRTLCAAVLGVLAVLTWNQAHVYADVEALWRDTLIKNPGAWMAWNNLGFELARQRRLDEAVDAHLRALSIRPDLHEAYNNLGNIETLRGDLERAEEYYVRAIELRPAYAEAHYNLGTLKYNHGDAGSARGHFERALQINPRLARAAYNLGVIAESSHQYDVAFSYFRRAVQADPVMTGAWFNLAALAERDGDVSGARSLYERALAGDPGYAPAHYNLAILCYETADYSAARRHALAAAQAGQPLPPAFLAGLSSKR